MSRRAPKISIVSDKWKPGSFLVSTGFGISKRRGWVYGGLGLRLCIPGSPKGRRPPMWILYHLGSGHILCKIDAHVDDAISISTELADVGDWTFDGLYGWKNVDPELLEKAVAVMRTHGKKCGRGGCGNHHPGEARAIAMARAS